MTTNIEHTQPNVCRFEEAPNFIKLLVKSIINVFDIQEYVAWSGNVDTGIRLGMGINTRHAVEKYNTTTATHRLLLHQEGTPIVGHGEEGMSVYYDQVGIRSSDKFFGLGYDIHHQCVTDFPKGPITLIQLNESVSALNKATNDIHTEGVELLHMKLGTAPWKRIGLQTSGNELDYEDEDYTGLFLEEDE